MRVRTMVAMVGMFVACGGKIAGDDLDFVYTVKDSLRPGADFTFDSIIQVDFDAKSKHASLASVTLAVVSPTGTKLDFLRDVRGVSEDGTQLVSRSQFPTGESTVAMDVNFNGDLQPLFRDSHTIVIHWRGELDPKFGPIPAGGIQVRLLVGLRQ